MSKRPVGPQFGTTQGFYGTFSTKFSGGTYHGAIDIATPSGTTVIAPDDGEIVFADWAWNLPGGPFDWESRWYQLKPAPGQTKVGGGIMTVLRNKNGWYWIFAHLGNNNMAPAGTKVKAGDKIAETDNTGSSTGPHLHLSLMPANPDRSNGAYGAVDPAPYLDEPYRLNTELLGQAAAINPGRHVAVKGGGKKSYKIINKPTGFQVARSFYGCGPKPQGITIHHWGADGQEHDDVDRFLTDVTSPARLANPTSAHEVISDGRVTVLADASVATYHAGSTAGNGKTIGLEVRPEMTAGDLDTLVQRIYDIERKWGSMPIYLHLHWFATACPGRYVKQLNKIIARVNAMHKNNGQDPEISTGSRVAAQKDWFEMATVAQLEDAVERVLAKKRPRAGGEKGTSSLLDEAAWGKRNFKDVRDALGKIPADVLKGSIQRPDKTTVNLATAVAYEKSNWGQSRARQDATDARIDNIEKKLDLVLGALGK